MAFIDSMSEALQSFLSEMTEKSGSVLSLEYEPKKDDIQTSEDQGGSKFFEMMSANSFGIENSNHTTDMIWLCTAIERYSSTIHNGHDRKGTDIIRKCPQYITRCGVDGDEYHVIKVAFDLRDSLVNSTSYNTLTTVTNGPLDVIKQNVFVQESDNERYVVIGPEIARDLTVRIKELPPTNGRKRFTLFSGFLATEIIECLTRYDAMKSGSALMKPYRKLIFV
jgi:hypothetical protein